MSKYQNKYRIESIRLKEWDYSTPWWYYVTISTKNHICWFGDVINSIMKLNESGVAAEMCWLKIPEHYATVELDYFRIMPNHVHGIIILNESQAVETGHAPSPQRHKKHSLSNVVGSFKSAVSKNLHKIGIKGFGWQSRFYERIIRNEAELYKIRKYIEENPLRWEIEKDNPKNLDI